MTDGARVQTTSAAEYLAWEREQLDKHEFHCGEVFAMAGGSPRHNLLASAMMVALAAATREHGCRVLSSDQRIAAEPQKRYVYADAVVVCGAPQTEPGASDVLSNPTAVVEVLSPSTEAYDRGVKSRAYRRLPSLSDYLLVSQTEPRIEHYRRDNDGSWRFFEYEAGDVITLANGAQLAVDAVYEGAFEYDAS